MYTLRIYWEQGFTIISQLESVYVTRLDEQETNKGLFEYEVSAFCFGSMYQHTLCNIHAFLTIIAKSHFD